jgi:hypothetical protein
VLDRTSVRYRTAFVCKDQVIIGSESGQALVSESSGYSRLKPGGSPMPTYRILTIGDDQHFSTYAEDRL